MRVFSAKKYGAPLSGLAKSISNFVLTQHHQNKGESNAHQEASCKHLPCTLWIILFIPNKPVEKNGSSFNTN